MRTRKHKWSVPRGCWRLAFIAPGCLAQFSNTHRPGVQRLWSEAEARSFLERPQRALMIGARAPNVLSPQSPSIKHNCRTRVRSGVFPRYTLRSHAGSWAITDYGAGCAPRKFYRSKRDWSAEDIYSFLDSLNKTEDWHPIQ